MAKKIVRVYLSTYVDVEMESDDFTSEAEMKEYVTEYLSDYIEASHLAENVAFEPLNIGVFNADE